MAIGVGADPYGGIGRWNRQRADALQGGGIAHRVAIGIAVAEALPARRRLMPGWVSST